MSVRRSSRPFGGIASLCRRLLEAKLPAFAPGATRSGRRRKSFGGQCEAEALESRVLLTIFSQADTIEFLADAAPGNRGTWTSDPGDTPFPGAIDVGAPGGTGIGDSVLRNDVSDLGEPFASFDVVFTPATPISGFAPRTPTADDPRFFSFSPIDPSVPGPTPTPFTVYSALPPGQILILPVPYTVTDTVNNEVASSVLFIHVRGVNDAPIAAPDPTPGGGGDDADSFTTTEDEIIGSGGTTGGAGTTVTVIANDSDPDGDTFSVTSFDRESRLGAAVNIAADGTFTYTPTNAAQVQELDAGDTEPDQFNYTITDSNGASSVGVVTITVTGVNDAPVAVADTFTTNEDRVLSGAFGSLAEGVIDNDQDVDGDDNLGQNVTVTAFDANSQLGGAVFVLADGSFSYDPTDVDAMFSLSEGQQIIDTFTYTLTDDSSASAVGTVTITVEGRNDAPTLVSPQILTDEDTAFTGRPGRFGLLDDVTDVDAIDVVGLNVLAVQEVVPSSLGAEVRISPDGTYTYDPTNAAAIQALTVGEIRTDSFSYQVRDSTGVRTPGTVTVSLTGVDDPVVGVSDSATTTEDASIDIAVLANDSLVDGNDVFGTDVFIVAVPPTSQRGATITGPNGDNTFTYDPQNAQQLQGLLDDQEVVDTFTYRLQNTTTNEITGDITVSVTVTGVTGDTNVEPQPPVDPPPLPGQPVLDLIRDDVGVPTSITWPRVSNGDRYELWINDSDGTRLTTVTFSESDFAVDEEPSYDLSDALVGEDHSAFVRAFNSDNLAGRWSEPVVVTDLNSVTLDFDGNGEFNFATDGIQLLAHAFGTSQDGLEPLRGSGFTRSGDTIDSTLTDLTADDGALDLDGDGVFVFGNDGILLLAYSFGVRGQALENYRASGSTRDAAGIETQLEALFAATSGRIQSPDRESAGTGFVDIPAFTFESVDDDERTDSPRQLTQSAPLTAVRRDISDHSDAAESANVHQEVATDFRDVENRVSQHEHDEEFARLAVDIDLLS